MKRQSRVTRPPIATLAIALLVVGCVAAPGDEPGSASTSEVAPSPTAAAPSAATRPSATVDDGAFWTTPAVPVGEIDSGEPVDRFGESRGAMSILLLGPFGDTASVASAVCSGIGGSGWPGVRSDPLPLLHPLKSSVGSNRRSVEVDAPPPGDWSISVTVGINDTVHGVVFTSPYYFRVRILP